MGAHVLVDEGGHDGFELFWIGAGLEEDVGVEVVAAIVVVERIGAEDAVEGAEGYEHIGVPV